MLNLLLFDEASDRTAMVQMPETEPVDFLLVLINIELNIDSSDVVLVVNDRVLPTGSSNGIASYGVRDNDTILVRRRGPQSGSVATSSAAVSSSVSSSGIRSAYDIPANITPDQLLQLCNSNPSIVDQLDPEISAAVKSGNIVNIRTALMARYLKAFKSDYQHQQELAAIEADPMNADNQRKIEEAIKNENINNNRNLAMENIPESFVAVCMLYVRISINDTPIMAFVDSGAQSTIMSIKCAEKCNLLHLIDTRYAGQARGVGTAAIIGRVHLAQIKFGNTFLPISLTILENNDVDFLFGLDMLRRHRCCIDLRRNRLICETNNDELEFLSEAEVEAHKLSS